MKNNQELTKTQLHKRQSQSRIWQIIRGVAERQMAMSVACQTLNLSRSRIYELVKRWKLFQEEDHPGGTPQTPLVYKRRAQKQSWGSKAIESFLKLELVHFREGSEFFRGHFNFAHLSDECHKRFKLRIHRNTLRRWAIRNQYFVPEKHSTAKPYLRFEAGAIGMLVQHDTSKHLWLPHTGRTNDLILTIDDHSRKILSAVLVPQETAWHHLCSIRNLVEIYGNPLAYYLDNHLIYGRKKVDLKTQFSRAMHQLGIHLKFTAKQYPQAKGKVEKRFDYFQRRLPLLFDRQKITSLTKANQILQAQVEYFNEHHLHAETHETPNARWDRAIKEGRTYFRDLPRNIPLDIVCSLQYSRRVRPDGSVLFAGKVIPVPNGPRRAIITLALKPPSLRRPHTEIFLIHGSQTLKHIVLPGSKQVFPAHNNALKFVQNSLLLHNAPVLKRLTSIDILGPLDPA